MRYEPLLPQHLVQLCSGDTVTDESDQIKDIQFINIAHRPEPQGMATGGPNGVLKVLRDRMGPTYRGFTCRYVFEPTQMEVSKHVKEYTKLHKLGTMARKIVEAEYFMSHIFGASVPEKFATGKGNKFVFVCHDIGSAVGAHFLGYPHVLIFHHQGAFFYERESFGESLNDSEKAIFNHYEKIAFETALEVAFPSKGAREAFEKTSTSTDFSKVNFAPEPLYNTVDEFDVDEEAARALLVKQGVWSLLNEETRKNSLVFISVGDFSFNKGLDRCPEILSRLAEKSDKNIVWIALGTKHKAGIFEHLLRESEKYKFQSVLIPERQPHATLMGLVKMSDWFLMQQRKAIFDFSSLEAMKLSKGLILSPLEGNLDFNVNDNVKYVDPEMITEEDLDFILNSDPEELGAKSFEGFSKSFSKDSFLSGYTRLYDRVIAKELRMNQKAALDDTAYEELREKILGQKIVIFGAGASANRVTKSQIEGKKLVALNSALLMDFPFDYHIMQDEPAALGLWNEYLKKDCTRIYGDIARGATQKLKIDFEYLETMKVQFTKYQMSSTVCDKRYEPLMIDLLSRPIQEMNGVLFSAIQLFVGLGAKSIELAGIDYSTQNFNGKNPNKYNVNTLNYLKFLIENLKTYPAKVKILQTDSEKVRSIVEDVDAYELETDFGMRVAELVNERLSFFRNLQALSAGKMWQGVIYYFKENASVEDVNSPKNLRELARAYFKLDKYREAKFILDLYFRLGGEAKECREMALDISG